MYNLSEKTKSVFAKAAVAAAQTAINGAVVDMTGFDSIVAEAIMGTVTDTNVCTLKLQAGTLADGSDMVDIAGATIATAAASTNSNQLVELDVKRFTALGKKYARAVLTPSVANAALAAMKYRLYDAHNPPPTADASMWKLGQVVGA